MTIDNYANKQADSRTSSHPRINVLICGSRGFSDYKLFERTLVQHLPPHTYLMSGGATGADSMAEHFAEQYHIPMRVFPAQWDKYKVDGRRNPAGMIRNKEMLVHAGMVIAFWDGQSKGTKDMMRISKAKGLEVIVINYNNPAPIEAPEDKSLLNEDCTWKAEPQLPALMDRYDISWVNELYRVKHESSVDSMIRIIFGDDDQLDAISQASTHRDELLKRRIHSTPSTKLNTVQPESQVPHSDLRVWGGPMPSHIIPGSKEWYETRAKMPYLATKVDKELSQKEDKWDKESRYIEQEEIEAQGVVEYEDYQAMVLQIQALKLEGESVTHEEVVEAFEAEFGCKLEHISQAMFFGVDWRIVQRDAIDGKEMVMTNQKAKLYHEGEVLEMKNTPAPGPHIGWTNVAQTYLNWIAVHDRTPQPNLFNPNLS